MGDTFKSTAFLYKNLLYVKVVSLKRVILEINISKKFYY
ncbi:hypothetical protein QEW_3053 [Clostridioides difficile CD160]|nr:hypothetical protein QEW_3053 [Clostridioides difficile CD160]